MTLLRRTPLRARRAEPKKEVPSWKKVPERTGLGKADDGREEVPEFLAFVREYPCLACRRRSQVEAHHWGKRPKGRKCSDWEAAPLCTRHHREWHDRGTIAGRTREEWIDLFRRASVRLRELFESQDP